MPKPLNFENSLVFDFLLSLPFASFSICVSISGSNSLTLSKTATKKPPVSEWCGKILTQFSIGMVSKNSLSGNMELATTFSLFSCASSAEFHRRFDFPQTCQSLNPFDRFKFGNSLLTSTNVNAPFVAFISDITTASFSIGFNEHVEYTILPPTFKICAALFAILICSECRPFPKPPCHRAQISGAFRIVPSPLHGTSHKMESNLKSS